LTIWALCDVPVWAEFTRLISAGLRRELAAGDAGLGLQQLQGPRRPPGGAQVCFPHGRLIKNPIVRNRIYRRGRGSPSLAVPYAALPARGRRTGMDIVLIAGLWLDGSVWGKVAAGLEARGRRAVPVTLPGQGDGNTSATLADQSAAVVAAVDAAAGRPMVVGHSAASSLAWLAADARPAKVSTVALIGGFPSPDGQAYFDGFPVQDGAMPFPGWGEFEGPDCADLDDAMQQSIASAAIPVPEGVARGVIRLTDERRYEVPVVLVCPEFTPEQAREWIDQGAVPELAKCKNVSFVDIDSGHWPMISAPAELARLLAQAAEQS
jgi:pimeloyl-ACP methyl ester carboxylesterase